MAGDDRVYVITEVPGAPGDEPDPAPAGPATGGVRDGEGEPGGRADRGDATSADRTADPATTGVMAAERPAGAACDAAPVRHKPRPYPGRGTGRRTVRAEAAASAPQAGAAAEPQRTDPAAAPGDTGADPAGTSTVAQPAYPRSVPVGDEPVDLPETAPWSQVAAPGSPVPTSPVDAVLVREPPGEVVDPWPPGMMARRRYRGRHRWGAPDLWYCRLEPSVQQRLSARMLNPHGSSQQRSTWARRLLSR